MSRRKHTNPERLTTKRLAELAEIIAEHDTYELGPQDRTDLVEALHELVGNRREAEIAAALGRSAA